MGGSIVTKENWQDTVMAAVADLPEDIQRSLGDLQGSAGDRISIPVAVKPMLEDDGEVSPSGVLVRWWDMREKEMESYVREFPQSRAERFHDFERWPGCSTIAIIRVGASSPVHCRTACRMSVSELIGYIQVAILEQLIESGGMRMISKDDDDRFVREDGTVILHWQ